MLKETAELIMVIKGEHNTNSHEPDTMERIKEYIKHRYYYLEHEEVTQERIFIEVKYAFINAICAVAQSSIGTVNHMLTSLFDCMTYRDVITQEDVLNKCIVALRLLQVKNKDTYINGFTAENTKQVIIRGMQE